MKATVVDIVKNMNSFGQVLIFCLEALRRNNNVPMTTKELMAAIALLNLKGFTLKRTICNELFVNHAMFVDGEDMIRIVENIPHANHVFKIQEDQFESVRSRHASPDFWGPV